VSGQAIPDLEIEPGTYRGRDGVLVHCRRDAGGTLVLATDGSHRLIRAPGPHCLAGAVKLSDEPSWPDEDDGASEGVWLTD